MHSLISMEAGEEWDEGDFEEVIWDENEVYLDSAVDELCKSYTFSWISKQMSVGTI